MSRKLNLSGLKYQRKRGMCKVKYLDGEVDFPLFVKDDRTFRKILSLSEYKFNTKLEGDKLVPTNLVKISNLKTDLKEIIYNSQDYSEKDNGYVKLYDEGVLKMAKLDRDTMIDGLAGTAHLDLDYIVNEETGMTFLGLLNETFSDIIMDMFGEPIKENDYYRVTELLYEVGLLSEEVIGELLIHIRALKTGNDVEIERYRYEAWKLGIDDIQGYVNYRTEEKKLKEDIDKIVQEKDRIDKITSEVELISEEEENKKEEDVKDEDKTVKKQRRKGKAE